PRLPARGTAPTHEYTFATRPVEGDRAEDRYRQVERVEIQLDPFDRRGRQSGAPNSVVFPEELVEVERETRRRLTANPADIDRIAFDALIDAAENRLPSAGVEGEAAAGRVADPLFGRMPVVVHQHELRRHQDRQTLSNSVPSIHLSRESERNGTNPKPGLVYCCGAKSGRSSGPSA